MEPVTAVGLAVNVIQAVELGVKIAKCCADLSAGGNSYASLEDQSKDLSICDRDLRQSITAVSDSRSLTKCEKDLLDTGSKCAAAANALQAEAQKYKVPTSGKGRKRQIMKVALMTSFGNSKMVQLEKELNGYRQDLQTRILTDLRYASPLIPEVTVKLCPAS